MKSNNYYITDPGDEQDGIFDYFTDHRSSAKVYNDYIDETDEE